MRLFRLVGQMQSAAFAPMVVTGILGAAVPGGLTRYGTGALLAHGCGITEYDGCSPGFSECGCRWAWIEMLDGCDMVRAAVGRARGDPYDGCAPVVADDASASCVDRWRCTLMPM